MLDYSGFFKEVGRFKEIQDKQKQRGLNDFNLLTTVRKYHDEVYLHSAMIGALLDPQGLHYQKTLFLELFLKEIGLDNWGLDLDKTSVNVEYKDIDLYITDGKKHIIIENKIFAKDQDCQLIKYINIIIEENKEIFKNAKENENIDADFLQVIYLTAQSKEVPDEHNVNEKGYIFFDNKKEKKLLKCSKSEHIKELVPNGLKNYKVKYKKITYTKEILQWLVKSKKQVANITNINEAMAQYIDVVRMVNNNYEGKVVSLQEYIEENELDFELLKDITNEYKVMIKNTQKLFMQQLYDRISIAYEDSEEDKYVILPVVDEIYLQIGIDNNKTFITLYKKDWKTIEDKSIVFDQLINISINNNKFKIPRWNGYATVDIMNVESKEFLETEKNVMTILEAIQKIVQILKT